MANNFNKFEYKKISPQEQQERGILGRLVGKIAAWKSPTRNGRVYKKDLWQKVLSDEIFQEKIQNKCCFGEIEHPLDGREAIDPEKIAFCLAETPTIADDGFVYGVFDILNSPCGKILKTILDYGTTVGVSSRGSGDLFTDYDGQETVDPDSYDLSCWDCVFVPAVKEARMQRVNESLERKQSLQESLNKLVEDANEEDKDVMRHTIDNLGLEMTPSEYRDGHEGEDLTDIEPENKEKPSQLEMDEDVNIRDLVGDEHEESDDDSEFQIPSNEEEEIAPETFTYKVIYRFPQNDNEFYFISNDCTDQDNAIERAKKELGDNIEIVSAKKIEDIHVNEALNDKHDYGCDCCGKRQPDGKIHWGCGAEVGLCDSCFNKLSDDEVSEFIDTGKFPMKESFDGILPIKGYDCYSYYDTSFRGLEDSFTTDDFSEMKDWVWEHFDKGNSIIVTNRVTGEQVELSPDDVDENGEYEVDTIDDPSEWLNDKFADFMNDEINSSEDDFDDEDEITYEVYQDIDGYTEVQFEGTREECQDWIRSADEEQQELYGEDYPEFQIRMKDESSNSGVNTSQKKGDDDIEEALEINEADNSGSDVIEALQEALKNKQQLEKEIIELQEKLSVCYAKEAKDEEQLSSLKKSVKELTESANQVEALKNRVSMLTEKLAKAREDSKADKSQIDSLNERLKVEQGQRQSLREDTSNKVVQIKELNERLVATEDAHKEEVASLNESIEGFKKDLEQVRSNYSQKLEKSNKLVEKYKKVASAAADRYIESQALRLGVNVNEIKNKLPESYSFDDIDSICESLQSYKLNMSRLPFRTSSGLNENVKMSVKNSTRDSIIPPVVDDFNDADEVDDMLKNLAGI